MRRALLWAGLSAGWLSRGLGGRVDGARDMTESETLRSSQGFGLTVLECIWMECLEEKIVHATLSVEAKRQVWWLLIFALSNELHVGWITREVCDHWDRAYICLLQF